MPLSLPAGALLVAGVRHHVTATAAYELSPGAVRRREAEERSRSRAAAGRAGRAPILYRDRPVLGAWVAGDLPWKAGPWCALAEPALGLGTVVLGLPGSGKTETLLRLSQLGLARGYSVHVLDAKGEPATQARFAQLASSLGVRPRLFPEEAYDGFRGDGKAIRNRLERIVDYSEPYYRDGARVLLAAACGSGPPGDLPGLLSRLEQASVPDLDAAVRRGTLARYRSFAAAVEDALDGSWAFEDARASYLLVDGVALGEDAARCARFLIEDFAHYASSRKEAGRRALLLVDEFSALRLPNAAALLERLRSFGAGVVVAAQSYEGLHDDENERARLLNAASTLVAHRMSDPDPVTTRAGTIRRPERSHQLSELGPTGQGSLRLQDTFRVDPNELRCLPPGMAFVVAGGRAARVAVSRGGQSGPEGHSGRRRHPLPGDPSLIEQRGPRPAPRQPTVPPPLPVRT